MGQTRSKPADRESAQVTFEEMSESMDFSDMFRRADGEGGKQVASKPRLTSTRRANEQEQSQENVPPTSLLNTAESDSMAYVKNALRNMNHDLETKDLTPAALQAIEMLYSEVCFEFCCSVCP